MTKKVLFHGECVIRELDKLPEDLKKMDLTGKSHVIIAESEVTGNHHRVLVENKAIEFYEKDGVLYMQR